MESVCNTAIYPLIEDHHLRDGRPVEPLVEVVQLPVHLGVGAAGEDCQGPEYSSVIAAVQYSTVQYSTGPTWQPS